MLESMTNPQPTTADKPTLQLFLKRNLTIIKSLFPDSIGPEDIMPDEEGIKPDKQPKVVENVTQSVWQQIKSDPVVGTLGEEAFNKLPPEEQLEIVEKALKMMEANEAIKKMREAKTIVSK